MRRVNRQKGFSLVELMVGVAVGVLAVYASYQIFQNVETNYRATETTNEAQMAGLYATFVIGQELGNAGAGVMSNFTRLSACNDPAISFPKYTDYTINPPSSQALPLYPLPVAILPPDPATDADGKPFPDEVFVYYGTGSVTDLALFGSGGSGQNFSLVAPPWPVAKKSVLVTTAGPNCGALEADVGLPNAAGIVTAKLNGSQFVDSVGPASAFVDLGSAVKRHFYVDDNGTLQMEIWRVDTGGNNFWRVERSVPIASNVVAFKAQYGVATTSGAADSWIAPDAATPRATPGQIISVGTPLARNIKAIRFGLIVRASEPDFALGNETGSDSSKRETLFADCPNGWDCTNGPSQDFDLLESEAGKPYGWRYRKYETTVPLQNTIWN
jgi:type IV pilus assembly protein PilW